MKLFDCPIFETHMKPCLIKASNKIFDNQNVKDIR